MFCAELLDAYEYFFFFNDTATTEIYTLSLHDALPISVQDDAAILSLGEGWTPLLHAGRLGEHIGCPHTLIKDESPNPTGRDRKSTRLNSSHANISYAVFCLKKKN